MLIILESNSDVKAKEKVIKKIESLGYQAHVILGTKRTVIGVTGNSNPLEKKDFLSIEGVQECVPVLQPYKLASRDFNPQDSEVRIRENIRVGRGNKLFIAGPCAVESFEQCLRIAKAVKAAGAQVFRAGAFKPRTSPYTFQGLGEEGLKILQAVSRELDMPTITEAVDVQSLEKVCEFSDMIQIGARNMQNFPLLKNVGKMKLPVLLKRGPSATLDEMLCAAEYILHYGNKQVILCERGLRNFDKHTRNTLDIAFVPVMRRLTHLPLMIDPSHAAGRSDIIPNLVRAAMAVGSDGVIVEVHDQPEKALSDGPQALLPQTFETLMTEVQNM